MNVLSCFKPAPPVASTLDSLDSVTKQKADYLIGKGMEVVGLSLLNRTTGERCSINTGRVIWEPPTENQND